MLEAYFGFKRIPFEREIKINQFMETSDMHEATSRLNYIKQYRGLFLLTGEPGSGKTSVIRSFVDSLNPEIFYHAYTPHSTVSRNDFYRQINYLLKLPPRGSKSRMFYQIQTCILDLFERKGKTPCIILDESQKMDHLTLEELTLLTNFKMDSKMPLILILVGQPSLKERLNRSSHEALSQRFNLTYHMSGLTVEETRTYVLHHLKLVGRSDPIFEENAFEILYRLSFGLPRKINRLAFSALTLAIVKKLQTIDADLVLKASSNK